LYPARHRRKRSGRWALGAALSAAVVCAGGVSTAALGLSGSAPAEAGASYVPASVATVPPRPTDDPRARPLTRSAPVSIRIPAIGVRARVMRLGQNADGTVQVPPLDDHNLAGWYRYGPAPGQRGAAVILGHVDSLTGISVFYHLKDLRPGDRVYVTLADGQAAAFTVDGLQKVAKDAFPTASVYSRSGYPSLRLITCGGAFDRATGHYEDNVIVYAHLTAT
jgi:sortase (surface protein transpeptidase)